MDITDRQLRNPMKNIKSLKAIRATIISCLLFLAACSQPAYIQQNNLLVADGQLEAAIANYRQLIGEEPDDGELYYQLAGILLRKGDTSEAGQVIDKAIIIDRLIDRYQLLAGKIRFAAHDNFEAINHLTNALILNPQYLEGYYYLGLALEKTGQSDKALSQLQAALSIEPLYFDAQLAWAEIKFQQLTQSTGDWNSSSTSTETADQTNTTPNAFQQLLDKLESALKIKPDSVQAHLLLARVQLSLGAEFKARTLLEKRLRDFGTDDRILLALARIEYQSGRFDKASQLLAKQATTDLPSRILLMKITIRTKPGPGTAADISTLLRKFPDSDELLLLSAQWELQQGNIVRAERQLQKCLALNPDFAQAYFTLSKIHAAQSDQSGSQWAVRKARQLAPGNLEIRLAYLNNLVEAGHWSEAEKLLNQYTPDSDHPEVNYLQGLIAEQKGELELAEKLYLQAQDKQYSIKIESRLAELELRRGQYHSAEARLKRISAIYPDNLDIALARTSLLLKTGQTPMISTLLTPHLANNRGNGKVHLLLAESFIQQGKTKAALKTLRQAVKRWPRNPELVQSYTFYLGLNNRYAEAIPLLEEMQTFSHQYNRLFFHRLRACYFRAGETAKFKNYHQRYQLRQNSVERHQ